MYAAATVTEASKTASLALNGNDTINGNSSRGLASIFFVVVLDETGVQLVNIPGIKSIFGGGGGGATPIILEILFFIDCIRVGGGGGGAFFRSKIVCNLSKARYNPIVQIEVVKNSIFTVFSSSIIL